MSLLVGSILLIFGVYFEARGGEKNRIVSVSVPGDEMLAELLEKCGKKADLVAVSALAGDGRYADVRPWALRLERASDSLEKILALKPTLVVASSFNRHQLREFLQKQTFKSHVLESFSSLEDIYGHLKTLGALTDCAAESANLIESLRIRLQALKQRTKALGTNNKILFFATQGYTYGKNTTQNSLSEHLGLRNVAGRSLVGWSKISMESLLEDEPDFVVVAGAEQAKEAQTFPGLKRLKAVRNGKIVVVQGKYLDSLSQTIAMAGEEIVAGLNR